MRRAVTLACCLVVALGACGRDEGSPVVEPPAAETDYSTTTAPAETGVSGIEATECEDRRSGPQALIEIEDFRFDPPCVEMTASQGFQLKNNGQVVHNFSVEGVLGIDVDIASGQENNTENPGLNADVYTFFCKYHRGQGMEGELRVVSG